MLLEVVNPFDQKIYVELPFDTDTRVRKKIHTARRAFEQWRRLPLGDRIGAVREGLNYFRTHKQAIAEEISCQMGKPLAQSRGEFGGFFERAYVHRSCYDVFIERVEAVMSEYRLGDPLDENTTVGPLASSATLDLLDHQVADAVARGARLILGGKRMAATDGNFYLPTLLVDVPNDAEVMQAESFGPILPVLAVGSDQEAVERMNDSRFGLTASVWTGSREKAEWFARRLKVGTVYQNRCDYLDPALPWTGVGDSGKGSSLSTYGYYHLTRRKSIHFRTET